VRARDLDDHALEVSSRQIDQEAAILLAGGLDYWLPKAVDPYRHFGIVDWLALRVQKAPL
jgi:hypothetical protein